MDEFTASQLFFCGCSRFGHGFQSQLFRQQPFLLLIQTLPQYDLL